MSKSTKFYSEKQEKMVADVLGGYAIGGSGAMPGAPGDVKTYDWLVECKTHTSPGNNIFFDMDVWKKIQKEAFAMHKKPVLVVDDGSQEESKTWCLCSALNLDHRSLMSVDLPMKIRKNITCKHDKLKKSLDDSIKRYLGPVFHASVYEITWGDEVVNVLPLSLFKEIFNQ